ncbi:MAG TPA: glycosyltransferase family 4 protein [Candidatus Marinimicrobia bacterium]|nr:glycosyltransferase family 4 protein [Candidatus Neomarinimicrobiota bacterium]HRS51543.1 glycosyltransferase family 4 protein [Candidatus Neomarinimicrobiota bacterium]HRU92921.1 glycosyltransferase family 4 protein [Candidatus Neomarinimicrobiota bacterium]
MKTNKQILIAHYTLPPVIGGVESILKPLAEVFARNDYLVTILSGAGSIEGQNIKTSLLPDLNPNSPHVREIQRVLKFGSLPEFYEYQMQNLQRRIEAEIGNIDTVIIHNIMTMPFNLMATEAFWNYILKYPDKKYYIWTHDLAWLIDEYKPNLYDRRPWSLLKTEIPNVIYIAVSEYRKRQMAELLNIPRRKILVVPNVIKYQDFFKFEPATNLITENLKIFKHYPVILIPARIIQRKNIERSIKVIASLRNTWPDLVGIITGVPEKENGSLTEYATGLYNLIRENNLSENLFFLGDLFEKLNIPAEKNRNVVRDLYFISNLVLYLSIDEGFGLPILEAGIARTPLAISQIPVFREVAQEGALYLPLDESPEYNANRIVKYLKDNQPRSDVLFKTIIQKNNWDNLWESQLKSIFNENTSGGGGN